MTEAEKVFDRQFNPKLRTLDARGSQLKGNKKETRHLISVILFVRRSWRSSESAVPLTGMQMPSAHVVAASLQYSFDYALADSFAMTPNVAGGQRPCASSITNHKRKE